MSTVHIKLDKSFTTSLNKLLKEYGEEFARIEGLGEKQLNLTSFIDNFVDTKTVSDASIDGNANVASKAVPTLLNEMSKPYQKLTGYNKIFYELNKKYGYKVADKWLRAQWEGWLYLHDAPSASYYSYCFAYDLKDLAEKGLYFIDNFNYEPPQHLGTFVDFVKEFVSYCSNSTSGACGMPNLIPYMYYFWKRDVNNGYYTRSPLDYAKQHIQRLVYALNQPFLRGQTQSAFTNVSIFDHKYLDALFGGAKFPDGSLMVEELEEIMKFQKVFLETVAEIRSKNMMTFPVLSISLLKKDGKFKDEEFARWACEHNRKWNDSNFFVDSSVTSLSNCCRLKNDIKDLYFNSIGGTALSVGSIKVNTINLAHIALATHSEQEYLTKLKEITELDLQCLDVVRHIILRNVEKGLLPIFSKGMIDEKHCYNTIGIIGVYETMKSFGYTREDEFGNVFYTEDAERFGKKIFDVIHNVKNVFSIDKDYKINCEAVPGESAAAKFLQKDKILYPNTVVEDLPLYGNQFIPLGIKTTLQERIRIAAMFDGFCNGGSILHINVDAPFDSTEKAWDMLNYVTDMGVTYFAFTGKIQACEKNHAFYGKKCPVCGGEVATEYSRIVGFWTPVRTYSKERKAEWKMRQWENING